MAKLTEIKGLTRGTANKLRRHGIRSVNTFLFKCGNLKDRRYFAKEIGVRYNQFTDWVKQADLFRIKGVGSQYSDLLERSGFTSTRDIARRTPQQIFNKLQATNDAKHIVHVMPSIRNIRSWVSQAKRMKKVVNL